MSTKINKITNILIPFIVFFEGFGEPYIKNTKN